MNARLGRRRTLALASLVTGAALVADNVLNAHASLARLALAPAADGLRLDVPDPSIPVRGEAISPVDTDAAIDIALEPHYVAFSPVPARGQLFLWLPPTGGLPGGTRVITDQAAQNGFRAINLRLRYPNTDAVQNLCGLEQDTTCFENTRLEILDGTARSAKVNVNRANSVENRVLKLLAYLDAQHPDEGWGAYVDGDALKWSSIVVAGHSQGGGHAALLARVHAVARVGMLSAPVDKIGPLQRSEAPPQPAPWLLGQHATPSERYFAFGHVGDETTNWVLQWPATNLGMTDFGPIVDVDETDPPYGGSHMLLTNAPPQDNPAPTTTANHASTGVDVRTPLTDDGQPLFAPVWQYICFA